MPELSHASLDVKLCGSSQAAHEYGPGGMWYHWKGTERRFPEDVTIVFVIMPVKWNEVNGDSDCDNYVPIAWATKSNETSTPNKWELSGTIDKPTLHPSLNWIGVWHGWLKNGRLESC